MYDTIVSKGIKVILIVQTNLEKIPSRSCKRRSPEQPLILETKSCLAVTPTIPTL